MRIGVLSLPLHTNYGGILQAYSLQIILKSLGHDVLFIDRVWIPRPSIKNLCKVLPVRFFRKYLKRENITLLPEQYYRAKEYEQRSRNTSRFIQENIDIKLVKGLSSIREKEFDAIVVGSDQVLRPKYFAGWGRIEDAYLDFAKKWVVKRIFYAASFGSEYCEYSTKQVASLKSLIQRFDAISSREYRGVEIFKEVLGVQAEHVLDPTFLLDKECYEKFTIDSKKTDGVLLNYILDDSKNKCQLIERIAADKHLEVFRVNNSESLKEQGIQASVESWLQAFRDADFVVTDSFHACVFSVIFHKPFLCVANEERGLSRFDIFSKQLGLSHNIITEANEYNSLWDYSPQYFTYEKLKGLKEGSLEFLKSNLG